MRFESAIKSNNIMTEDESESLTANTWFRAAQLVEKVGYMDGASDGQTAVFQSSFDTGYEQGFKFGLEIGFRDAMQRLKENQNTSGPQFSDPRKINCQICINSATSQDNIGNLYNSQKEKNDEYMKSH